MADCSVSLALYTENQCFPTIYYLIVGYENLGIPLSDVMSKSKKLKFISHVTEVIRKCAYQLNALK